MVDVDFTGRRLHPHPPPQLQDHGLSYWIGSWCWDAFRMTRSEAKKLLGHLRKNG
jgi:hypothetical protein